MSKITHAGRSQLYFQMVLISAVASFVLFALFVISPIQDYALTEYRSYVIHPSPETLDAFRRKQGQEWRARWMFAAPFGISAALLTVPLLRIRKRLRDSN